MNRGKARRLLHETRVHILTAARWPADELGRSLERRLVDRALAESAEAHKWERHVEPELSVEGPDFVVRLWIA